MQAVELSIFVCIINSMGVGGKGSWGDKEKERNYLLSLSIEIIVV